MTPRPVDRKAVKRVLALKAELRTWRAVAAHLGVNVGEAFNVANGSRRASKKLLKALGLVTRHKPALTISMSRDDARDLILDSAYLPDWLRQKMIEAARKYDIRTNRPDSPPEASAKS